MSHLYIEMNYRNQINVLGPVAIDGATVTPRQRALIAAIVLHKSNGATADGSLRSLPTLLRPAVPTRW